MTRDLDRMIETLRHPYDQWLENVARFDDDVAVSDVSYTTIVAATHLRQRKHHRNTYEVLKRPFDFLAALILSFVTAPLVALIAVAVKLDSPGPVFFCQLRGGRYGIPFLIFKFRTMPDRYRSAARNKPLEKPHVGASTKVGSFLRKYKLDEIPQVWNVVLGDMSLVGPRPVPLYDSVCVTLPHFDRFAVRPGMTGLWQVTAPHDASAEVKLAYDAQYARITGFWRPFVLDLKLLFSTFAVVLRGER